MRNPEKDIRTVYQRGEFAIQEVKDGYIIWNTEKDFQDGHTHISDLDTAKRIISLSVHKEVPKKLSRYLRVSLIRLSSDSDYTARIMAGAGNYMNFGEAVSRMRKGSKLTREKWVDGMYTFYIPDRVFHYSELDEQFQEKLNNTHSDEVMVKGFFNMRDQNGTLIVGWMASMEDMLADDWRIVRERIMRDRDGGTFRRDQEESTDDQTER